MKILALSDLHGVLPDVATMPDSDLFLICGDISPVSGGHHPMTQKHWTINHFIPWCVELRRTVVFIAGNHDKYLEYAMKQSLEREFRSFLPANIHYLRDSSVRIDGLNIYGTPWSPQFMGWSFMDEDENLHRRFEGIPDATDILLTHGPAYGWNDTVLQRVDRMDEHLGSHSLRQHIHRVKPSWVFCGHIHTGNHNPTTVQHDDGMKVTNVVNVSLMDERYQPVFKPFEFDLDGYLSREKVR